MSNKKLLSPYTRVTEHEHTDQRSSRKRRCSYVEAPHDRYCHLAVRSIPVHSFLIHPRPFPVALPFLLFLNLLISIFVLGFISFYITSNLLVRSRPECKRQPLFSVILEFLRARLLASWTASSSYLLLSITLCLRIQARQPSLVPEKTPLLHHAHNERYRPRAHLAFSGRPC